MQKTEIFRLFGTCIFVKGYYKSIIYDLVNGDYYRLPSYIGNEIWINQEKSKYAMSSFADMDADKTLKNWYNKLIDLGLGTFCIEEEAEKLPQIDLSWDLPYRIANSIVYFNQKTIGQIFSKLSQAMCPNVQIRLSTCIDEALISDISHELIESNIKTIEVISKYSNTINYKHLADLSKKNFRLRRFYFMSASNNEYFQCGRSIAVFSTQSINIKCSCVNSDYFSINALLFTESQHHNTCLNRKLCIDNDGYIKNCPYMDQHYGHISDTNIEEVIETPEFQKWWHIKKDDIDVCKDCEFRHMCTDCRAFIKDPENIYSQPAKCTYNPYICKWEGEEGYVPVEECGTYSRETGFVPDKKKIEKLNREIWGDE